MGSTHYKRGGGTVNGPKIKEEVEGRGGNEEKIRSVSSAVSSNTNRYERVSDLLLLDR